MILYVILGIIGLLVLYFFSIYNKLQQLKVRIGASIQEIGNQLKRQAELIPNLSEAVKGYLKHEKGIFEDLTNARKAVAEAVSSGDVDKMAKAGAESSRVLGALFALVENTPEIKGSILVQDLMANLRDSSDKIMYSRRLLVELSAQYNMMLVTIPTSLVASIFGFKPEKGLVTPLEGEHLEVFAEETKTPKVDLG